MSCTEWLGANHTYFQIANLFLAFTYFVPNTIKGFLLLRFFLGTAGFFFSMWAGIILCAADTLAWNIVFIVVNFGHASYMLYKMRRINFDDENELVYTTLFESLGIERWQYAPLANISTVKEIPNTEILAIENKTQGECVSIITSGSIRVEKHNKFLNRLMPYAFIDSPEWIMSTQSGGAMPVTYEVTVISEGCVIIQWQRKTLLKILRTNTFVKNVFDSIIGRDIASKLFDSQKSLMQHVSVNVDTQSLPSVVYEPSGDTTRQTKAKGATEPNEQTLVLHNNVQPKYGAIHSLIAE